MKSTKAVLALAALMITAAACGSSTVKATGGAADAKPGSGKAITLAVNPWTGSKVNAEVAKVVLESKLGTAVTLTALDESPTWPALDSGSVDAVLEVWPSGHVDDKKTYIDDKKSVVDIGVLGPKAKIGWYVNSAALAANPKFATIDGFKDAAATKAFATAESGDQGQFLMGDPSYVTFDKQIIDNLKLPLKYVESGSEATLITAIQNAEKDKKPLLLQFWQPHWLQSKVKLTEVKLPAVSAECSASAAAKDGKYACDYPIDNVYKAASVKLKGKNAKAFAFLSKMQLTTEQQNEIAAMIDGDGKASDVAAKTWVDAHADIVKAWLA
jgi:glycine betaine/proline transport system substrate-binding protein